MTRLTKAINEMMEVLEMSAMDLCEAVSLNNLIDEHNQIETEDEIRKHLVNIAFSSRMTDSGKKVYSKVCEINDNYFKFLIAA